MRRLVHFLVPATMIVMAPLSASAEPAVVEDSSATAADPRVVRLQIETSAMGAEAKSTRSWVRRDGSAALVEAGVEVSAEVDTEVRVIIEPKDLGYTVTIEVREQGAEVPSFTRGPKLCETCTRTELVGLVGRELAWVGGWLARPGTDESPVGSESADEDTVSDEQTDPLDEPAAQDVSAGAPSASPRLHALGWSGIGLGAAGLGTFVGGLAIVVRDYRARGEPGNYQTPTLRPKPIGWTMVGVGAGALVGGTVMLVFDLVKGKRTGVAAGPWLEPGTGGLWVRRRF